MAELTTGQLVMLICGGLVGLAAVFGLGVIVGKLDPTTQVSAGAPAETPKPATETYTIPAVTEGEAQAAKTEGESGTTPTGAKRNPDTAKPRSPFTDTSPRLSSLPPLPANDPKAIQVEAPSREPRPDTPAAPGPEGEAAQPVETAPAQTAAAQPPASAPAVAAPAATLPAAPPAKEVPELTPITPEEPPVEELPMEPVKEAPAAAAPAQSASPAGMGKFGIQLVAFRGDDRRTSADALKQKLKTNAGLNAEVIPSPDDQNYRVIVVGYPDKQSAEKALNDVRTKTGFKDAFIKSL